MRFFTKHHTDTSYGALIDISSGSIGIGIVVSSKSEAVPKLIYAHREQLRVRTHDVALARDSRVVREGILATALTYLGEGINALRNYEPGAQLDQLFVTCSAPWSQTISRTVTRTEDAPFKITKAGIDALMQEAEALITACIADTSEKDDTEYTVVEKATVDVSVNEYVIHNPIGQKGTTLGLTHIAGLIPHDIYKTVEEVHHKILPTTRMRVHTSMLVTFCVLRDILPALDTVCLISIGGESTEFGIVRGGLLIDNSAVPLGTHSLLRALHEAHGRPIADIQTDMQVASEEQKVTLDKFEPFTSRYRDAVRAHVAELHGAHTLPREILISAPLPFLPYMKSLITEVIGGVTDASCTVRGIDETCTDTIAEHIDPHNRDMLLALSARFFHKLHGCTEPEETE